MSSITLERGCFGCADASITELRRDGTVTRTLPGNARLGTAEQVSRGRVPTADFERLARLAVAQGYFGLRDSYEDPQLQDGPWTQTRLTLASGVAAKQVLRRDDAGPALLKSFEAELDAVAARAGVTEPRR